MIHGIKAMVKKKCEIDKPYTQNILWLQLFSALFISSGVIIFMFKQRLNTECQGLLNA